MNLFKIKSFDAKKIKLKKSCRFGEKYSLRVEMLTNDKDIYEFMTYYFSSFEVMNDNINDTNVEFIFGRIGRKKLKRLINLMEKLPSGFAGTKKYVIENRFYLLTEKGSLFFGDKYNRYGYIFISSEDFACQRDLSMLIINFLIRFLRFYHTIVIHSACLVNPQGEALLLPGRSGCGKTTLSSKLAKLSSGFKVINDDLVYLFASASSVYLFSIPPRKNPLIPEENVLICNDRYMPKYIIFPYLLNSGKSDLMPVDKHRALKELIPLSEMGREQRDIKMRMSILSILINQCACYIFRNIKDNEYAGGKLYNFFGKFLR